MEDNGCYGNVVTNRGHNFHHAHGPGPIARIGNGGAVGGCSLGANNGGKRIATVAKAHGGKEAAWLFKAKVAVGHRVDVADIG